MILQSPLLADSFRCDSKLIVRLRNNMINHQKTGFWRLLIATTLVHPSNLGQIGPLDSPQNMPMFVFFQDLSQNEVSVTISRFRFFRLTKTRCTYDSSSTYQWYLIPIFIWLETQGQGIRRSFCHSDPRILTTPRWQWGRNIHIQPMSAL